jgi:hypothetical protein
MPAAVSARFLLENVGDRMWTHSATTPIHAAVAVGVMVADRLIDRIPLRQNICADERAPVAFEFAAPAAAGEHELRLFLMPVAAADTTAGATEFHASRLTIHRADGSASRAARARQRRRGSSRPTWRAET